MSNFPLIFVNLLLAWMLYFHKRLPNKAKFLVWREYNNQFGIYQTSWVSLLEPWQSNLHNLEAYSEPCQIFKMECFVKIVNGYKPLTFFVKHFILDTCQVSEYASVICYSLFRKIEDAKRLIQLQCKFAHFKI